MSDDEEFDDYESASHHHPNHLAEKTVESQLEPMIGVGLLDNFSEPTNTPSLQRFFSLDSNPMSSSPLDFNQLLNNQAIDPYLDKKDNSRESIDQPYLIGFHKHSSEMQPNNLSNLTLEFTSFIPSSHTTENHSSLPSAETQDSVNHWFSSKEIGQVYEGKIMLQNQFQKQNNTGNSKPQTNNFGDMKLFSYQNVAPKIVETYSFEKTTMENQNNVFGSFDSSATADNPLTAVLPDYKKLEEQMVALETKAADNLGWDGAGSKQRRESDEFEYVSTQDTTSSHLQAQELQPTTVQNYNSRPDEPQIWPEYFQTTIQTEKQNQISLQKATYIVENKLKVDDIKTTLPSLQTKTIEFKFDQSIVSKQDHEDQDEFVFGDHSDEPQEFLFQEVSGQAVHVSSQQQQEEDEFGEFSQTHFHQRHHETQLGNNIVNSDNLVKISAQYAESASAAYYLSKEKELQLFMNSLPDYSRLLAQAQHS